MTIQNYLKELKYTKYKICGLCKQKLPLTKNFFYKDKTKICGFQSLCKQCSKLYIKKYYDMNKDILRKKKLLYQQTKNGLQTHRKSVNKQHRLHQKIINDLKLNGCAICGYDNNYSLLHFHHVNKKIKKYQIINCNVTKSDFIDELHKCILLCAWCHRRMHLKCGEKNEK